MSEELLRAAAATIPFLPSATPLEARELAPGDPTPSPDALGVRASLVGTSSAELLLVASDLVQEALAGADGLTVGDALRPALEAAAGQLGTGVLDSTQELEVGSILSDPGWQVAALVSTGQVEGWFALRFSDNSSEGMPGNLGEAAAAVVNAATGGGIGGAGASPDRSKLTPEQRAESMRLLYDVDMTLTAEIGRTKLAVRDVLDLSPGAVIELDRSAGSPADVMVNGRLIARGEIVVVDEEYGIRITEIVTLQEQNG